MLNISIPYWLKRIIYPKISPICSEEFALLLESKRWSINQLREYQWKKLSDMIEHAYTNTEYYNTVFKKRGITPNQIKDFDDYRSKIPLLTKDEIIKNTDRLLTINPKKLLKVSTGGSTGIPMTIYLEKNRTYELTRAYEWRQFNEGGYYPGDKVAIFRGRIMEGSLFYFDALKNSLHLSVADMSDETLGLYVEKLLEFKPKHVRGYPSALELLAKYIVNNRVEFNKNGFLNSIFTSSEMLKDDVRQLIEYGLRAKIFDKYGNSEQCTIIGQCSFGHYHEYMEFSYTEYLTDDNNLATNGLARIVSTSFVNRAMPLLRYDIGDYVELIPQKKCPCGMEHKMVKRIIGRKTDFLIGKNGKK